MSPRAIASRISRSAPRMYAPTLRALVKPAASVAAARAAIASNWKAYSATQMTDEERALVAKVEAATPAADTTVEALYALFAANGFGGKDFSAVIQLLRGRLDKLT